MPALKGIYIVLDAYVENKVLDWREGLLEYVQIYGAEYITFLNGSISR